MNVSTTRPWSTISDWPCSRIFALFFWQRDRGTQNGSLNCTVPPATIVSHGPAHHTFVVDTFRDEVSIRRPSLSTLAEFTTCCPSVTVRYGMKPASPASACLVLVSLSTKPPVMAPLDSCHESALLGIEARSRPSQRYVCALDRSSQPQLHDRSG